MYPASFLDELRLKISVSDVISKKVALKLRGREYLGLCPFHNEKTPSFTVNDQKSFYHCFGCGAHGDIIKYTMETEGLSFKEAIEKLATDYSVSLPKLEKSNKTQEQDQAIDTLYKINEETCKYFERNLFSSIGKAGLSYIHKRGLRENHIKKFRIGFGLPGYDNLINYLKKLGYTEQNMLDAGVVARKEKGSYDKFRNRVIFPIMNKRGRVIAFTGRVIDDAMPKYMNSPETEIYQKRNTIFNYFFARKAIYDEKYALLVEGNIDVFSLFIHGIENVISPMGTAITIEQLEELWKTTDTIVVCLDGDKAGLKASERISELVLPLINYKKNIKFVFLAENTDPDDLIRKKGKDYFLNSVLAKKINLSEFIWNNELLKLEISNLEKVNPEKKTVLEQRLLKFSQNIQDPKSKNNFSLFFKNNLWQLGWGKKKVQTIKSDSEFHNKIVPSTKSSEDYQGRIAKIENEIFNIIIPKPEIIEKLLLKYGIDLFVTNFSISNSCEALNIIEKQINKEFKDQESYFEEIKKLKIIKSIKQNNSLEEKTIGTLRCLLIDREINIFKIELFNLSSDDVNYGQKINLVSKQIKDLEKQNNIIKSDIGVL